jgi:hypothetical protein
MPAVRSCTCRDGHYEPLARSAPSQPWPRATTVILAVAMTIGAVGWWLFFREVIRWMR